MHAQTTASPEWIGWAAGLFEGEGCIHVGRDRTGREFAWLSLTSTDRDVTERFGAVVGIGSVIAQPLRPQPRYKPSFKWTASRTAEVAALLALFMPYLGERRRAKAEAALRVCAGIVPRSKTHCPHGHEYTEANTYWERLPTGRDQRRCRACVRKRNGVRNPRPRTT